MSATSTMGGSCLSLDEGAALERMMGQFNGDEKDEEAEEGDDEEEEEEEEPGPKVAGESVNHGAVR